MFPKRLSKLIALLGLLLTLATGHVAFAHSGLVAPASETTVIAAKPTIGVSVIEFYDVKTRKKVSIGSKQIYK